ncbi:Sjogren's syndrome/scleroderma autoantigen 1 family protein [Natronococcus occultus]|uniref:Putative Zn-finger containing protein n=1 Tax=Natronococcus occultus SP4 TaxID=694430 RepID=L0K596_9EURY|nr:Sjogren's syndrome/scleroderma autoantigen 1 family protein [Natronococcus occultus]AGB39720.1 putative Zn-finger containing protein [Natronococcus occultus SP4]
MSDFDKEAEREKLREKYERDKAEREATQRMSDLLLKGATMTNNHCGTCGDPLFQQDDTTFCPSCHGNPDAVQGTSLEAQPAEDGPEPEGTDESADGSDRPEPEIDVTRSETDADGPDTAPDRAGQGQTADTDPAGDASARPSSPPSRSTADGEVRTQSRDDRSRDPEPDRAQRDRHHGESRRPADRSRRATDSRTRATSGSGELEDARASLVAALEKFAREASETDDPRYARECLEAAREAGETLETLR